MKHPYLLRFGASLALGLLLLAIAAALAQKSPPPARQSDPSALDEKAGVTSEVNPDVSVMQIPPNAVPYRPVPAPASPHVIAGQGYVGEIEPNNGFTSATPLGGNNVVARGNVFPNADIDFYSFTANAGDRVYAAVMTSYSSSASTDSQLRLLQTDGTTEVEFDEDDGSLGGLSSSIANATIPSAGTYYLEVKHFSATNTLRPYDLHFRLQSGAPTPEVESNDTPATANPLPASGWVSGTRNPAVATEQDWFSFTANAGDTVYLGLDLDPERDNVQWNGRLGIALFGDADNQILVVDDASVGSFANPLSEAFFMTVKTAGTYYAFVDSATAATGGPTATYTLSVSIHPAANEGVNCTTYTSTNVPQTIGPGAGLVSSIITVPGNPRIADLDVSIDLNHALMADLDMHLRSPAGNNNALFNDIGAAATGGQTMMDIRLDDEAGVPFVFTVLRPLVLKPELQYRLDWYDGELAGGVWTLDIRDDLANASGGTLNGWSITICEPAPLPACGVGFSQTTVFSTDFEGGASGFTHSGTADEWELGLPATVATTTPNPVAAFLECNSGTNCWKTDLDSTYEVSANQDLLSPNIDLTGLSGPINLTWAQKYQMESATFDHYFVEVREVGNPTNSRHVYDWTGATMTAVVGSPVENIGESAGWGVFNADISDFAGLNVEVRFHVDSDTSINLAGVAIDDVAVTACVASACTISCPANITFSNAAGMCGAVVTYPAPTTTGSCGAVTCSPASGSFFPVGTTTVNCSTASGPSCSFTVTVNDIIAPTITCPANISQPAPACASSAVVNYTTPTATDNCPGVTVVCTPPSGSSFPLGTTTVSCTATDASMNTATCSFNVQVTATPGSPTITTNASPATTIGSPVSDSATLAGGCTPTGTITFNLYGPDDATCGGAPVFTDTVAVSGSGTYPSGNFTPAAPGVYRWIASYSGDPNNNAVAGMCNDANESVVVGAPPAVLRNLSTRMRVETGENIGIGGFIIDGTVPKHVIIRAIGPDLMRFGLTGFLADPVLELHGPSGFMTIMNDDWRDTDQAAIAATGIPPTNDSESAIVADLAPGAYTALVSGKNGTSGLALVEVYDLDPSAASALANLSTRAFVNSGNNLVIAGFILGQASGDDNVVIRGLGPSLTAAGVANVLSDPALQLRDTNGTLVRSNNDWQDDSAQAMAISGVGLGLTDSAEAAIYATLPAGAYTALLVGQNGVTGVGLVEIYQIGIVP